MSHANARLTVHARLELVRRVVQDGRPVAHVATELNCSRATGYKWLRRWREQGATGLVDRPSIAHRLPGKTPAALEARIIELRQTRKLGPARIAPLVGVAASTVHAVLTRHRLQRLAWMDRPTGQLVRRYERATPGELIHIDVKKLGRLRDGGGWRVHGRDSDQFRRAPSLPRVGYDYIHCAIDDHSRLAYAEIQSDETSATCAGFLLRAAAAFRAHGINRIERVMTDNALAYRRGRAWREALEDLNAHAVFTRRYRPQTNGKAERFNRTLLDEWAYARPFTSNNERAQALPKLATHLQPSQITHRARRPPAHQSRQQPAWALQLALCRARSRRPEKDTGRRPIWRRCWPARRHALPQWPRTRSRDATTKLGFLPQRLSSARVL